ncbi:IPT/TIG domain-containing protein, partial [Candidatus Thiothrix sp. Deng01]
KFRLKVGTAGAYQFQVRNAADKVSGWANLTVTEPAIPTPAITALSPNNVVQAETEQDFTLTGSNFQSGSMVYFKLPSGNLSVIPAENTTYVSSSTLKFRLKVGTAGAYQFQVRNTADKVSGWISLNVEASNANDATKIIPIIMQILLE